MRVASIIAKNRDAALDHISKALPFADVIELRFDYWEKLDISDIKELRQAISLPVIFTLRKFSQGGYSEIDEEQRLSMIQALAGLKPDYIDLEFDVPESFVVALHAAHPTIQLICSYHDFEKTPADLMPLFQKIYRPYFQIFKIATFAQTTNDTLRLLVFLKHMSQQHQMIGMAMGECGEISRIFSPIVGSLFTYASVDSNTVSAPGQLTLRELTEIYHVQLLNRNTNIYALLGDPVAHSQGHIFHNAAFIRFKKNAVYVKLKISKERLGEAMKLLRQLPFQGFSVTMPHKETIVPFVNELMSDAKAISVVNTIKREGETYQGFNTDGIAGAEILEEKMALQDKKILVLGAGGSAKAIAYALIARGAQIVFCNRTLERAQHFTQKFGGDCISFSELFAMRSLPYDAIVNTLPVYAFLEQCADWKISSHEKRVAMDIVYQATPTPFIQLARDIGWECISGDVLFTRQASLQLKIWYPSKNT